jgi:hypothetical protein
MTESTLKAAYLFNSVHLYIQNNIASAIIGRLKKIFWLVPGAAADRVSLVLPLFRRISSEAPELVHMCIVSKINIHVP